MANKYWFRPKRYGYGFTPISWEGWVVTGVLLILVLTSAYANNVFTDTPLVQDWLRFLLDVVILSMLFALQFERKTKGELKWHRGRNSDTPGV